MRNTTDSVENDISDIIKRQIINAWDEGKNLRQIVKETGITIKEVNRNLKPRLKAAVRHGVEHHGETINL